MARMSSWPVSHVVPPTRIRVSMDSAALPSPGSTRTGRTGRRPRVRISAGDSAMMRRMAGTPAALTCVMTPSRCPYYQSAMVSKT